MNSKYPNLKLGKKIGKVDKGEEWRLANIKDGFNYFFDLNGRYPTSLEIDKFEYLPTSRSIQRGFGGIQQLRKQLNIDCPENYTKGKYRSEKCKDMYKNSRDYEEDFYYFLLSKLPVIRVHEQKRIRPGNVASDFFIYTNNITGVVIDIFYCDDLKHLNAIINIKMQRYRLVKERTYLIIVGKGQIEQPQVDNLMANKKNPLPSNINVLTDQYFKIHFDQFVKIEKD